MRKYNQTVEFANFICHFGQHELLNFLEEIVIPAFTEGARTRIYGDSKYLLHDIRVENIKTHGSTDLEPAIFGKFVLDTTLRRDQIFSNGKLIPSPKALQSAPSSFFVLLLRNHKLLYTKQVAGAPGLNAFRTTAELLLKWERTAYVNKLYEDAKNSELRAGQKRVTKKLIAEAIPAPTLEIVHLSGASSIKAFVNQFTVLKEVRIKVVKPNNELNNDKLFSDVQRAREEVGAESTSLTHRNPTGLDKKAALKQIIPAVDGNAELNLSGLGEGDRKLSGNNEDIKVTTAVELPANPIAGASVLLLAYRKMVRSGMLLIAKSTLSRGDSDKLKRVMNG